MALILIIGNKNYSSWSLRAWLTLKQSGLPFEEVRILLNTPETHDRILQYSPSGRVPALRDGDLLVWESIAICEYIAELAPDRKLLPDDRQSRAIMRSVSAEMHSGFQALREQMPMDCRSRIQQTPTPEVQANIDRICAIWQQCRQQFGQGGDLLFGQFTLADAMYAPVVSRFVTYGVKLEPIAQAYADAVWSLPAMQEWLSAAQAESEVITDHQL